MHQAMQYDEPTEGLSDEERAMREERRARIDGLGAALEQKRCRWVQARAASKIEKRWQAAIDHYEGRDIGQATQSLAEQAAAQMIMTGRPAQQQHRSSIFVDLTRQLTDAAEARLADMLLPNDDKNWGLEPTPIPELVKAIDDPSPAMTPNGHPIMMVGPQTGGAAQPATRGDLAKETMRQAQEACDGMASEIEDQLAECQFEAEQRLVIHDAAKMGVGILEGPVTVGRTKRAWRRVSDGQRTVYVMEVVEDLRPASERCSPWDFVPDPSCGENIHDGEGVYRRRYMSARRLRELAKVDGYDREAIERILKEGPQRGSDIDAQRSRRSHETGGAEDNRYEVWYYYGDIDTDDLRAAGCDCGEDAPPTVSAVVTMANGCVIKATMNPLETGEFPFDVIVWSRIEGSWVGHGVPHLMLFAQRILNAATRQMMDNSGRAALPQTVINKDDIKPADGSYQITPGKLWFLINANKDIRQVFAEFYTDSKQAEFEKIIDLAIRFAHEAAGVPQLMQANQLDPKVTPQTLGGMAMLFQAANTMLRRLVRQFDDRLTTPHLRRYYDWDMMHGDRDEIKGDYQVVARGSSALFIRDQSAQEFLNLFQLANHPMIGQEIDWREAFVEFLKARRIPETILKSEEQKKADAQNQPAGPPPDPRVVSAQLRIDGEREARADAREARREEMAFDAQQREADRMFESYMKQIDQNIEAMKMARDENISLEKIKAMLADTAMQVRNKRELFNAEANLKLQTGQGI